MMKKKEKVTLSQMRESLAKACQFHFELFRAAHRELLKARRAGDLHIEVEYISRVSSARWCATQLYDLYLESQGYGRHVHSNKQNKTDLKRMFHENHEKSKNDL